MKNSLNLLLVLLSGLLMAPRNVFAQDAPSNDRSITVSLPALPSHANPLEMALIPAGSYQMGSPDSDSDRYGDETPKHSVAIEKDFYLGKYEITQAQWQAVMGENPSQIPSGPNDPVDGVSWNDCQAFIEKLNATGRGRFRLPTEAEWEYACRAGTNSRFYWGDEPFDVDIYTQENAASSSLTQMGPNEVRITDDGDSMLDLSNQKDVDPPNNRELTVRWNLEETALKDVHVYVRENEKDKLVYLGRTADGSAQMFRWRAGVQNLNDPYIEGPQDGHAYRFAVYGLPSSPSGNIAGPFFCAGPVTFQTQTASAPAPNPFGLENLCWNVWEWCQDAYDPDFYKHSPKNDPINYNRAALRVCRGGSKYNSATFQRCAARGKGDPDSRYYYIGLRIARDK